MRKIEEKIISRFGSLMSSNAIGDSRKVYKLSTRDMVKNIGVCVTYSLHGFVLFFYDTVENAFYFVPTTEGSKYTSCMSATTKSRLNVFLRHFADTSITQKNFENYFKNGEKVIVNSTYRISNKTIIKL